MKAASALVTGHTPEPELAGAAVRAALAEAGLERANNVILFLSRDFSRNAQAAVLAAARAAGCLSVGGCTASGLFTERGWQMDRPTAAALVFTAPPRQLAPDSPLLSFSGHARLPFEWQDGTRRAGLLDADAATWSHGRTTASGCAEFSLPGLHAQVLRADGLRLLADAQLIDACRTYELSRVGGCSAVDSLRRALPAELRDDPPWHQISLLRRPGEPGVAILSANADGSLTLAEAMSEGGMITWAIRQPLAAEQEIRQSLTAAAKREKLPDFALMFSCIGRGPLFYGNDDRDLQVFRETFPGTPLLGVYGTGQICPLVGRNRLFQNTALTLLFESLNV